MSEIFLIKVQRITKPKVIPLDLKSLSYPLTSQPESKTLTSAFLPFNLGNQYYQLNPAFGRMYVGEKLKIIVSVANNSNLTIDSVNIQAEMVTETKEGDSSQRDIQDAVHLKNIFHQTIKPLETITFPIEYSVDYPDVFFLCLNVFYKFEQVVRVREELRTEIFEKTQVKRFKFGAELPYKIKNRANQDRKTGKVFLEIEMENSSKNTLFFKELNLVPSEFYNLVPLQINDTDTNKLSLNVGEGYHLIYCLEPKKLEGQAPPPFKALETLGQLYTEWYNILNENGNAFSPPITFSIPRHDLTLEFSQPLNRLTKEIMFAAEMTVKNETNAPIDMIFNLVEKEATGIKIISLSKNELKLAPGKSEVVVLFLLPVRLGIYKFTGIKIYNRLAQKELTFNSLPGIIIEEAENQEGGEGKVVSSNYDESLI